MSDDILKGKWKELRGKAKEQWGKLTDDDLTRIDGKTEQLLGILQQKYGYTKEKTNDAVNNFLEKHKSKK